MVCPHRPGADALDPGQSRRNLRAKESMGIADDADLIYSPNSRRVRGRAGRGGRREEVLKPSTAPATAHGKGAPDAAIEEMQPGRRESWSPN